MPLSVRPCIEKGQRVKAGTTKIGVVDYGAKETPEEASL
jgi:hypothetical protein